MYTHFAKESSYDNFFKVEYQLKKSNKGYHRLIPVEIEGISKSAYYKQPAEKRSVFFDVYAPITMSKQIRKIVGENVNFNAMINND